jgi:hypothetical protein
VWSKFLNIAQNQMKKTWQPHKHKHKGPVEPDRTILEIARARELLTTYELSNKDKALVDRHLATSEKVYGENAEQRIRQWMRWIRNNERVA